MEWKRGVLLGRGASGTVSVARMASSSKPSLMAVKSSPLSNSRSLFVEKVFLQHLERCGYIIRCYGDDLTFENDESIYNVFLQYAAGGSLADRIRVAGGSLPEEEVRKHTNSILMGLSYIHKQGYAHCDIKPQNVLLVKRRNKGMVAKIADLGLIRKAGKGKEKMEDGINVVSKLRGTAMYMAPESVNRNEYGHGVDIWALGCTAIEMLTGKYPWDPSMGNVPILFKLGCTEQLPEIPSGLSPLARDFLKRCLVRDTKLRWTADMLLSHPFITGEIDEAEAIKPILIMSDTLLCGGGKRLQNDVEGCRKRTRIEDHDEEELKLEKRGSCYWGIKKRSLDVASSCTTPIQIFN